MATAGFAAASLVSASASLAQDGFEPRRIPREWVEMAEAQSTPQPTSTRPAAAPAARLQVPVGRSQDVHNPTGPVAARQSAAGMSTEQRVSKTEQRDTKVERTTFLQEPGSLNWRRRGDEGSATRVALAGPQNQFDLGGYATPDPIDDPFGDRQGGVPATAVGGPAVEAQAFPARNTATRNTPPRNTTARAMRQEGELIEETKIEIDCEAFSQRLDNARLQGIKLSVSPTFRPQASVTDEPDSIEDARAMQQVVEWTDRQGNVLAVGRVHDYINGLVIVQQDNGQLVQLDRNALSNASYEVLADFWSLPNECILPERGLASRDHWIPQTYTWKASALCHKPLYFEDIQLERYGHSSGPLVQPFKSGAHFFLNIAALPYNVGVYPPNECRYALGYYRPGNCAPFRGYALPLSARGALTASSVYVGMPFVLP